MIRRATADDVPTLAALERDLFARDAWSEPVVAATVASAHQHAWLDDDRGYVVTMVAGDLADLMRIAVRPPERRRGLARALLDTAVAHAVAAGAERLLLEVSAANDGALAFYAAEGFDRIDVRPRYYADGSDALVLSRGLR